MNIGISNILSDRSTSYSAEALLKIELNYNIANEEFQSAIDDCNKFSVAFDNVMSLYNVSRTFNSYEAFSVVKSLVGHQLDNYSMEGFIGDAWAKIKAFFVKIFKAIGNFFTAAWQKLKSLFTKKKAASKAAVNFVKKHPEAAKALEPKLLPMVKSAEATKRTMMTEEEQDARDDAEDESAAKLDAWKKAHGAKATTNDPPAAIALLCEAAPSVPVPPKAKEIFKAATIPSASGIANMTKFMVKKVTDFNNRLKKLDDAMTDAGGNYDRTLSGRNVKGGWIGEYRFVENGAPYREIMNDQSEKATVLYFLGEDSVHNAMTDPVSYFKDKMQTEIPNKLGDVATLIRAFEKASTDANKLKSEVNTTYTTLKEDLATLETYMKNYSKMKNQTGNETNAALSKFTKRALTATSYVLNGVRKFITYIVTSLTLLQNKEAAILAVEERASGSDGLTDE